MPCRNRTGVPDLGAGEQDPGGDPEVGDRLREDTGKGWSRHAGCMPRLGAVDIYPSENDCEEFFVLTRRVEEE